MNTPTTSAATGRVTAPGSWGNMPSALLAALESPWYRLMVDLGDVVTRATAEFARGEGLRAVHLPLTTRTVTCPNGLGSDSAPVAVTVSGVDTYLSDSAQFPLEYGCRLAENGCYTILPSFRNEIPDGSHLTQFTHSEAEIPGGLDDVIGYVERYLRHVGRTILDEYGRELAAATDDVSHIERMANGSGPFPRVTLDEAERLLSGSPNCLAGTERWRSLTRRGERRLMEMVGEFVWLTHLDHLSVPFYQAFDDDRTGTARCADLFFGMGEVVGLGERHRSGDEVRRALEMHAVPEHDYDWYVRMKDRFPQRTAGFGMGVERYLMWVVGHDDIRDIPIISRVDEPRSWPPSVDRP